ncbi:MAG: phospholipid/cholesterol/gamma-HCH transport system permease protein [Marinoscillum sp.]|jgi:phospholipid/cholesterol/gamma-HCH transport system permease protein
MIGVQVDKKPDILVVTPKKYIFNRGVDAYFRGVSEGVHFTGRFFRELVKSPIHFREVTRQAFDIGLKSLPLIALTGFIIGLVFTKQSRPSLEDFGATSWLPSLMGIAIVRALGPLVTALICAGKVGSNIGAELGSMKVTEQIDAMEVSAINPFKFLVVTRVLATTITIPILSIFCIAVGLLGSYLNIHAEEATGFISFVNGAFSSVSFLDIFSSLTKSVFYGFTIGMVGCYKGYNATQGTQGVGRAANKAVVLSMFLIFMEEVVVVQVSNWIRLF